MASKLDGEIQEILESYKRYPFGTKELPHMSGNQAMAAIEAYANDRVVEELKTWLPLYERWADEGIFGPINHLTPRIAKLTNVEGLIQEIKDRANAEATSKLAQKKPDKK